MEERKIIENMSFLNSNVLLFSDIKILQQYGYFLLQNVGIFCEMSVVVFYC